MSLTSRNAGDNEGTVIAKVLPDVENARRMNDVEANLGHTCDDHNKDLNFYCKTHRTVCCETCVDDNHHRCPTDTVTNIIFGFNGELQKSKLIRAEIEENEGYLRNVLQNAKSQMQLEKRKAQNMFIEIKRRVDETENKILNELENDGQNKIAMISVGLEKYLELKESINGIILTGEGLSSGTEDEDSNNQPREGVIEMTTSHSGAVQLERLGELIKFSGRQRDEASRIEDCLQDLSGLRKIGSVLVEKNIDIIEQLYHSIENVITLESQTPPPTENFVLNREIVFAYEIKSISFLPGTDKFVILSENPNQIQRVTSRGHPKNYNRLPGSPHDLCFYGNKIAITIPSKSQICIYDVKQLAWKRNIKTQARCFGIYRMEETRSFVVTFTRVVRNISDGNVILNKSQPMFKKPNSVILSDCKEFVLVGDWRENRVVTLSKDLQTVINIVTNPDFLGPYRLCIGVMGSVFVCCNNSRCIVKLDNDGTLVSTILCEKDQLLDSPATICYNADSKTLAVGYCRGSLLSSEIQIFKTQ